MYRRFIQLKPEIISRIVLGVIIGAIPPYGGAAGKAHRYTDVCLRLKASINSFDVTLYFVFML